MTDDRGRDWLPFAVAVVSALVSMGALAGAVAFGWLGPDVDRGANFCEASDCAVRQPVNTFSNVGFVVAGLLIGWHARHRGSLGYTLGRSRAVTVLLAVVVVLLGPASAAMHATESDLGGRLDMTSMYLIASFAASYAWFRALGRSQGWFVVTFVGAVAACEVVGSLDVAVPVLLHPGNVAFLLLLLAALFGELVLGRTSYVRTDLRWGVGAVASLLVAFVIWNAGQHGWCDPDSPWQAHGAWHLLCALAAYLLFRLYASERATASSRNQTVVS